MPYKVIEDSWTGTRTARENIEELERDGRVLVSRTIVSSTSTREPQMKMVFLDEVGKISPPVDQGAPAIATFR
jgi:cytosine/adenosine deaminase-related metal-dependent hydrolase